MRVINTDTDEVFPRITTITIFNPWPFGVTSVQTGKNYGYLDDGVYLEPDNWWLQDQEENIIVEFSTGRCAVASRPSIDRYNSTHGYPEVKW